MPTSNRIGPLAAVLALFFLGWLAFIDLDGDDRVHAEAANSSIYGKWSEQEVCESSVRVYFFLMNPPDYIGKFSDFHQFRSSSGHIYNCTMNGTRALMRWVNASGQNMRSESTQISIRQDGGLHVTTNMGSKTFY